MLKIYNENRKIIAILFALFLLVSIIFLGLIGNRAIELENEINQAEEEYQENLEKYLQASFDMLRTYQNIIDYGWETAITFQPNLEDDEFIDVFINSVIVPEEMAGEYFIFIVYGTGEEKELIYKGFTDERYEDIELPVEANYRLKYDGDFGDENRFFYLTSDLKHEDIHIQVHVGFLEEVIYDSYIRTTELDYILAFRDHAQAILWLISFFMIAVSVIGIYSLYKTLKLMKTEMSPDSYWNLYVLSEFIQSDKDIRKYLNRVLREEDMPSIDKLLTRLQELIDERKEGECDE